MPSQRRIGLTGGIASGKSSVGRWLEARGIPVLDADQYARDALSPRSPGAEAVLKRYGTRVCAASSIDGATPGSASVLDRATLGQIVFNDPKERQWLEQLVHPIVRQRFDAALNGLQHEPLVVLMIPLLYEAGLESLCSEAWVVSCTNEQQLERLMVRDGLSTEDANARIKAQWPLERKQVLADHIIDNSGSPEAWQQQVSQLL